MAELVNSGGQRDSVQERWGGFDWRLAAGEGALRLAHNLSSRHYPLLAPRRLRHDCPLGVGTEPVYQLAAPNGFILIDGVAAWVDGTDLYFDGAKVSGEAGLSDGRKSLAVMGRRLLIWPDRKYYNFDSERTEAAFGSLEAGVETDSLTFKNDFYAGEAAECNAVYNAALDFSAAGFRAGDAVTIAGCSQHTGNNKTPIIREISEDGHTLRFYEYVFDLDWAATVDGEGKLYISGAKATPTSGGSYWFSDGDKKYSFSMPALAAGDALVWTGTVLTKGGAAIDIAVTDDVSGCLGELGLTEYRDYTESGELSLIRGVPELDGLMVHDNRVWGYKGATIYASKQGDPRNWQVFDGLADDAWQWEDQSEGDFTGVISYLGCPVFFKRRRIVKVMGYAPKNYATSPTAAEGVAAGCGSSLAVADNVCYYYGDNGFMAYQGSFPRNVHQAFDTARYAQVRAGSDGRRYWAAAKGATDVWHIFVLDTETGGWYAEDGGEVVAWACDRDIWWLDATGRLRTYQDGVAGAVAEEAFGWEAELADIDEGALGPKLCNEVSLRYHAGEAAEVKLWAGYGAGGAWELLRVLPAAVKDSVVTLPVPHRADHYRLRLTGLGEDFVLYAMLRRGSVGGRR